MIEPPRDKGRLEHVLSAIARVEEFTSGINKEHNDILWLVITEDLPLLKVQIESYLREME